MIDKTLKKSISLMMNYNSQELFKNQANLSEIRCQVHQYRIEYFTLNLKKSIMFLCYQCVKALKTQQYFPASLFYNFIQIGIYLDSSSYSIISKVDEIKRNIKEFLLQKIIKKQKYLSFYEVLTDKQKQFLESKSFLLLNSQFLIDKQKSMIQNEQKIMIKSWIKQPNDFELKYNIEMNINNLKTVSWLEHSLDLTNRLLKVFFKTINIRLRYFSSQNIFLNWYLMNYDKYKVDEDIYKLIEYHKSQTCLKKYLVFNNLYYWIVKQTKIQSIKQCLNKFIGLNQDYQNNFLSKESKFKFKITQNSTYNTFKHFNFNMTFSTITLKDSNLNQISIYEQQQYQDEFKYLNDGQYCFKNSYRFNIFCDEGINEMKKDRNIFIGREIIQQNYPFFNKINQKYAKVIEIEPSLQNKQKIFLKLQLNQQECDLVSVGIRWSDSFSSFIQGIHNLYVDIKLKIIPDVNENSPIYEMVKDQLHLLKNNRKKITFLQNFEDFQEEVILLLEDDVISMNLDSFQGNQKIIFTNQTRKIILKQVQFKNQSLIFGNNAGLFPIFAAVALYNSNAEIQIVNFFQQIQYSQF